ncbi:hypothetical protein CAPTEDRAFT_131639 [Capitella teleta]|uniref:Exoribonuclease phosphorolytic domain-containing protein n=1 Tax=Capitella teleta TaxID=283909 RepID=R7UE18_CAPTE|nr:hypothetical protein CAPTEDRAFT_131639 [Capitella teleta]|eukprot:ELU04341.1 hypothetical protein CAPTEDRAFT_131639 [Capitella teleta]
MRIETDSETGLTTLSQGKTEVVAAIEGPSWGKRKPSVRVFLDQFERRPAGLSKASSLFLRSVFGEIIHHHAYPNTSLSIHIHPLRSDGSLLSAAVNAAMAAVLGDSISCSGIHCAVSVCVGEDGTVAADPDERAEQRSTSLHTFVFRVQQKDTDELVGCTSTGVFSEDKLLECYAAAKTAAEEVWRKMQTAFGGPQPTTG